MGFGPHQLSSSELAALIVAERENEPFLAYRDGAGDLRFVPLAGRRRLTVGRAEGNDVVLGWDPQVSRAHAQLECAAGVWMLVDDGRSRNGCYVDGTRVQGRARLADGSMLRFGGTSVLFRAPAHGVETTVPATAASLVRLTQAERRVLVALCRPLLGTDRLGPPASNREIGERLSLSAAGVKTHIRSLFAKLEIDDLPQNRKGRRARAARHRDGPRHDARRPRLTGRGLARASPFVSGQPRGRTPAYAPMACAGDIAVLELHPARGLRRRLGDGAVIGRDGACDVQLPDPLVSRRHAVVLGTCGGTFIEDLGSANGLFLNGDRCTRTLALRCGDIVQLGATIWKVVG